MTTSAPTPLPTTVQAVREFLAKNLVISFPNGRGSQTGTGITVYSGSITSATYSDRYICIAKFVAPVSGVYKVTGNQMHKAIPQILR